jgi:23S rRNA pseudouridine2605 synthase
MERIAKYLAQCGIASRRKAEEYVKDGLVTVNGKVIEHLGTKIDPEADHIKVGRKLIRPKVRKYYVVNKPKNIITSKADDLDRQTVIDMLPAKHSDVHPVGRLDKDTTGLLILTNDGELTNALTHPRFHAEKRYRVTIKGHLKEADLKKIKKGIWLSEGKTRPAKARIERTTREGTVIDISIFEGRNRQIRRMITALGYAVKHLERIAIGPLKLNQLPRGAWRCLNAREIKKLKEYINEISTS